jgi:RimJ/RimL family protein N-acetyltransferase
MSTRIVSDPGLVYSFCRQYIPIPVVAGMKGLGLERDGELVAGVVYEGFNGHNVWMHVAAEPGAKWMTRGYLRYCFYYPFVELGCSRVSGYVEASNEVARRFDEHLGFRQEAVLNGAASDGGDVILYAMRREECRYVPLAHN